MDWVPPPGVPAPAQPKTSSQAVWSLVLGILSITCLWIFGSIPAIILGILALKKIDQAPQQIGGRGLAITGIITGGSGVLLGITAVAIMASIATPAFTTMNRNAKITKESSNVRQLILACKLYAADDPEGKFPPNLEILVEEGYLDFEEILMTVDSETGETVPFFYIAGVTDDGTDAPLIIGPKWMGGKRVVGFTNGSVRALGEAEFEATIGSEILEQ